MDGIYDAFWKLISSAVQLGVYNLLECWFDKDIRMAYDKTHSSSGNDVMDGSKVMSVLNRAFAGNVIDRRDAAAAIRQFEGTVSSETCNS